MIRHISKSISPGQLHTRPSGEMVQCVVGSIQYASLKLLRTGKQTNKRADVLTPNSRCRPGEKRRERERTGRLAGAKSN
jgi:hypothetical protein